MQLIQYMFRLDYDSKSSSSGKNTDEKEDEDNVPKQDAGVSKK